MRQKKAEKRLGRRVYLDHAATTYLDARVKRVMDEFWSDNFGNPSALYYEGRRAREAVENARRQVAGILNASPQEIIFTNGGTESDNLAIFGVVRKLKRQSSQKKIHIITSKFEHHAVLHPCQELEKEGIDVTYLDVGREGIINPSEVEKALRPETALVSIMYANNEIGTIQPIGKVGRIVEAFRRAKKSKLGPQYPLFHSDACQAPEYLDLDTKKLKVDLLTLNGSKIYGPKGIGMLFIRQGVPLEPILYGGSQERKFRPGTENVPAIVGFAEALNIAQQGREKESQRLEKLRDYFINRLLKEIPKTVLNGHPSERLPNNVNVSILDVEGEAVILYLDEYGISCSTGSACTSESFEPSHVILALGRPHAYAHGSVRFTMGRKTTKKEIDYTVEKLKEVVEKLRSISAVNIKL